MNGPSCYNGHKTPQDNSNYPIMLGIYAKRLLNLHKVTALSYLQYMKSTLYIAANDAHVKYDHK